MNTCRSCKHWSQQTIEEEDEVLSQSYGDRHYCWLLSHKTNEGREISEENDAEAAAHGIGGANITTGPNFGCIHHEEKINET